VLVPEGISLDHLAIAQRILMWKSYQYCC